MAAKITYKKNNKWWITHRCYKSKNGARYIIKLDMDNYIYYIKNISSNRIVKKGGQKINNKNVLLREARRALINLGVELNTKPNMNTSKRKNQIKKLHKINKERFNGDTNSNS